MKLIWGVFALTLVPITVSAQQPDSKKASGDDWHCEGPQWQMFRDLCRKMEQDGKDMQATIDKVNELRKAAQDLEKARSTDPNQQIDGLTGLAKDGNSNGNNNAVSKEVTDKSIDIMNQIAHHGKEILDNVGKTVQSVTEPPSGSSSSFGAGSHQLNELKKSNAGSQPLTIQQQIQQQAEKTHAATVKAIVDADQEAQAEKDRLARQAAAQAAAVAATAQAEKDRLARQAAAQTAAAAAAAQAENQRLAQQAAAQAAAANHSNSTRPPTVSGGKATNSAAAQRITVSSSARTNNGTAFHAVRRCDDNNCYVSKVFQMPVQRVKVDPILNPRGDDRWLVNPRGQTFDEFLKARYPQYANRWGADAGVLWSGADSPTREGAEAQRRDSLHFEDNIAVDWP